MWIPQSANSSANPSAILIARGLCKPSDFTILHKQTQKHRD